MPHKPYLSLLMTLAALGGSVAVAHAAPMAAVKPPLAAKVTACTTGDEPAARAATFTGSMPALKGTDHMAMRFVLLQRRGTTGRFKGVDVPDWGTWEQSEAGRPGFVFTKRIARLLAPAAYKAQITFVWYDARGHVQRRSRRTTAACEQPDPRPNLAVGKVTAAGIGGSKATYAVIVRNDGPGVAQPFGVTLAVGGVTIGPVSVGPLAGLTREQATLTGPRCAPGSTVVVTVDSGGVVDESREDDDVARRLCPLTR